MDAFYSTSSAAAAADWCYDSHNKFREISPAVRSHLKLVYRAVCFALVSSAVGAYLHVALNIGGMLTMLACMGNIVLFSLTPVYEERKRFVLLMAAAILQGATICPLIHLPMDFDPSILATGFVGIAIALGCFSCVTNIAKRSVTSIAKRSEYMYLLVLLSSDMSILLWLQLATSIFVLLTGSFMVEVYSGILIFVGYMVYDMHQIVERAHRGDMDYIGHALTLFTDITAVLDRIFIIMNAGDKSEDKKKKRSMLQPNNACMSARSCDFARHSSSELY
ncbi:bax inhibitor 1-like [Aegilops tauschii subsp. strangulata]|uniref:bax inhibitor 1-like n=1 Tax=Aegilops tauschii subsp. strangulata TaxID=200361 RepID=UPI00098B2339|nr:bax inhibitor 1-like [Aegilops tauschii subsp. strangulata]